ncbi:LysR family transcriptional regulator [Gracilibacillus sp. YIM 98692]|uniref:LysR family transcriptional regulator n=1 Tax=Gracilibacillus sp. YIM 98692 TaxID=2663532 RepID=UPI0013D221E9|nr:LysR family transcriptional regulator [Gracilibacillus sp. YIM 98692]
MIEPLKVFVVVVELESFSKAAEQLYLTQPSVSQQVRNLEKDMGVQLLDRTPKYVKITEAGQIVYKRAKNMIALYEEAKEEIRKLNNEIGGILRIGAGLSIGESILPRMLSSYTKDYPLVDIKTTIENNDSIIKKLRAGDIDIGLISEDVRSSDLITNKLMDDELVIITPTNHPFSKHEFIQNNQLVDQTWILRERGSGTRAYVDQLFAELGLTLKRSFIFNSSQALKEAVSTDLGISIVSKFIIKKDIESGYLNMTRLQNRKLSRSFYIVSLKKQKKTQALQAFENELHTLRMY